MNVNKAFLFGNLTRDPEIRALPSGQQVANFSIATNRSYKAQDGSKKEQVEYHNVVAFGRQAEVISQYLKKGRSIFVEGRIQTRSWDKDGVKQYRTEIVIENFQFGPGGQGQGGGYQGGSSNDSQDRQEAPSQDQGDAIQYPDEEINPEDIPF